MLYDQSEPYAINLDSSIIPSYLSPRDYFGPIIIPEDSLFVLGDNRDNSADSRFWGFVDKKTIKAKVVNVYWSWDKSNKKVRWDRIGKFIK